ncbi:hypothetical protein [Pseudomonas typographi]|nr:hypothetical protein [Pseudomonas typographi]MBD1554035.1 hypothetical protein [Pseudomonas typographi]MBD1589220.1 hypothetical protein [Pseudomonas typographi]
MLSVLMLAAATAAGCASHPEDRPFAAEEQYQLALESLARQGLPYETYMRQRAALVQRHHAAGDVAEAPSSDAAQGHQS